MTEEEWLTAPNLAPKWSHPYFPDDPRKIRLWVIASCRHLQHWIHNPRETAALEAAEEYADGREGDSAMEDWRAEVAVIRDSIPQYRDGSWAPDWYAHHVVMLVATPAASADWEAVPAYLALLCSGEDFGEQLSRSSTRLCRDIFGNPFRPVSFDTSWRTSTAVAIAQAMYDARDFGAMPILADALQDAGCDNDDVLSHCRAADGVHVRGCWVVDLVLGKS